MWKSLFFSARPEKTEKKLCGMYVWGKWKEKSRYEVFHISVERKLWNVEKKWKRRNRKLFIFPPVLWNVESFSTGMCKIRKSQRSRIFLMISSTIPLVLESFFIFFSTCCTA